MFDQMLADAVLLLHFAFVAFVLVGGLLVAHWPKLVWLHLPAALWGAMVEFTGWFCPLTPLENALRRRAGLAGYSSGFVENYLGPLIYPAGLTAGGQLWLGLLVVATNCAFYARVIVRLRRRRTRERPSGCVPRRFLDRG